MGPLEEELRGRLECAGQPHLLRFWAELGPAQREALLGPLALLEPEALAEHCRRAAQACARERRPCPEKLEGRIQPLPPEVLGSVGSGDLEALRRWEEEGLRQISQGKVAALLLAGGQGTRLGVPYPKGMFDVGLPSHKTLYQIQAERIRKVQQLAGQKFGSQGLVPWYIMTSEFTLGPTEKFFQDHNYFHLDKSNVIMFEQRMLPAVTFDGKVILEEKGKIAMAPDGNGGLYRALVDHKILEDMQRRGIQFVHVYCVDNILVKMADPVFIGFCVLKGADCGAKVVEKAYAAEPVGLVCRVDGAFQVVEYSEIAAETAEKRSPDGRLAYGAGNICNHFFSLDFLREVVEQFESQLTPHVAIKKVAYVDEEGRRVEPLEPNGIKLEKNFVVFEVLREEEFSPLKNADTATRDTPTTARRSILSQHYRWAIKAGGRFVTGDGQPIPEKESFSQDEEPPAVCEISPLVSYFGEGLEKYMRGKNLPSPFLLDENKPEFLALAEAGWLHFGEKVNISFKN
ncbi:UDP-N-acetylhexosamine pyrophosphorylase-like protein 1 isoform X2 [Ahaetulla prasina]|uniref:UDP-N-acetylhexosamine pyrophosphorylase-like protein 1 isoform X2 n=1 Tax=Ahaetulla prasina TaxID=499056 RepID=UPI002648D6F1|nr:UDP-N-acetylhexosamine pyrophosphorylase-like protein 1 isoform X2 [Ahaetulla prasina]